MYTKGMEANGMNREQLIAPEHYNIAMEFEKYAKVTGKKALIYIKAEGQKKRNYI